VYTFDGGSSSMTVADAVKRDVKLYIGDAWCKFMWRKLRLEIEAVVITGRIGNDTTTGRGLDKTGLDVSILQWGGAFQSEYHLLHDSLRLGLDYGIASGDQRGGLGTRPLQAADRQYDNTTPATEGQDLAINNFRFHPDFRVDLILWREVLGQITDAMYFKPWVSYHIVENVGAGLDIIYSRAIYPESTPGYDYNLGLEFDLHLFYVSDDGFRVSVDYGILVPFDGLDNLGADYRPNDPAFRDPNSKTAPVGRDENASPPATYRPGEVNWTQADRNRDYYASVAQRVRILFGITF
jgi:uncharacterized protein (TIGR04551 family)